VHCWVIKITLASNSLSLQITSHDLGNLISKFYQHSWNRGLAIATHPHMVLKGDWFVKICLITYKIGAHTVNTFITAVGDCGAKPNKTWTFNTYTGAVVVFSLQHCYQAPTRNSKVKKVVYNSKVETEIQVLQWNKKKSQTQLKQNKFKNDIMITWISLRHSL